MQSDDLGKRCHDHSSSTTTEQCFAIPLCRLLTLSNRQRSLLRFFHTEQYKIQCVTMYDCRTFVTNSKFPPPAPTCSHLLHQNATTRSSWSVSCCHQEYISGENSIEIYLPRNTLSLSMPKLKQCIYMQAHRQTARTYIQI